MSANDDELREEDIISDLETGEVDPRIQARDRGEAARGEPIRVSRETDPGLVSRARAAAGATFALPASFIEQTTSGGRRVVEAGRGVVERGQEVVERGREIEEETFERIDREVERVTGVDVPEVRGRLRELDPFDRREGRERELELVSRVRDPIAERAEPITEPVQEQLDRLGAGATVVGRGAQAVGTRVVAPVSAGIATIEALERFEESPGFRGEVERPEDREPVAPTEQQVPDRPARGERAIEPELGVPESREPVIPGEQAVPERPAERAVEPEIGVPEEQQQVDPTVIGTQQQAIVREEGLEPEIIDEDDILTGEEIASREEVVVPEEERFTQISEELERRQEAEREEINGFEDAPSGFREREIQEVREPELANPDDVLLGEEQVGLVDQPSRTRQRELVGLDEDLAILEESLQLQDELGEPIEDVLQQQEPALTSRPPEFIEEPGIGTPPDYPPEFPTDIGTPTTTTTTPTDIGPPRRPPPRPRIPELDEYPDEQERFESPGRFDFQLVTDLPAPGELDDLPEPPSMDADNELPSMEPPEFPDPP